MTAAPSSATGRPVLPAAGTPAGPDLLRELRRFHHGSAPGTPLPVDALPALLAAFRDPDRVRDDYPILLDPDGACTAIADLLRQSIPPEARVLRDNLARLEWTLREMLARGPDRDARSLVRAAGEQMLLDLALQPEPSRAARSDLAMLADAVPAGELLPLDHDTPQRILQALARVRVAGARQALRERVADLHDGMQSLLQVESGKDAGARQPQALQKSLGPGAGRFMDPAALARAVGQHRGSARLSSERRERVQAATRVLAHHLTAVHPDPEFVVHAELAGAAAAFDSEASRMAQLVRAIRLADLELHGAYEPARHDPLLAQLDWTVFHAQELHALPVVAAVVPAHALLADGLLGLSRLLLSGRPVQVLALQAPASDPTAPAPDPAAKYRFELAYLGVAHREAYVQQSTAARPGHLTQGFRRALSGARTALHVIDSGATAAGSPSPLGAFLHAGAAIEGRAHPLFHYDPEAGETWARRFHFDHNPQPDADWPHDELSCDRQKLGLAFTFADFALLEPGWRDQFALIPDDAGSDEFVPIAEHLLLDPESAARRIPFVWVATADRRLHRAAVRRELCRASRDRLRFWHTLQELAGVRNEYVREAVQRARQEVAAQAEREREALAARHAEELQRLRAEASGEAMAGLARMLLELEPMAANASPAAAPPKPPEPVAVPPAAAAAEPPPAAVAPPEEDGFDDAWIETARCSSCNDCINLNPLLFVYNENKQARIGDRSKGTYAQLVLAAEKCPSRCIHPGKPIDPDEPGLPELIARAAPFNA